MLLVGACSGEGDDDDVARDGGVARDAGSVRDAGPPPRDGGPPRDAGFIDGLPVLADLCRASDADTPSPLPIANEFRCSIQPIDAPDPLFTVTATLAPEVFALHALCGTMNPARGTVDHVETATLSEAIDAFFESVLERPSLVRALSGVEDSSGARVRALRSVWLGNNGFEHILCGHLGDPGRVSGLHLWSELYLAEAEGRANYLCSAEGFDDPKVVSARFEWVPPGETVAAVKPIGSMHVGMSPACVLALGYHAITTGVAPSVGSVPAFYAEVYGEHVPFVFFARDGDLVSLYPLADPP